MALNQVDISMMQDIPAPGPEGKIIISDGTDWTSGENTPVGSIVKQATDPTPTDPATPTLGDMILNTGNGKLFNCTDATAGAAVWIDALPAAGADGQVLTSDGTNWASEAAAVGGGGAWEVIGTMVGDDSGALTITGMDTTYDKYAVSISNLRAAYQGGGTHGKIRLGTSGGMISSSNSYRRTMLYMMDSNGPHLASGYATEIAAAEGSVEQDIRGGWDAMFYIDAPRGAQRVKLYGHTAWTLEGGDPANVGMNMFSGILAASGQAVDRVQAFFTSGNVLSGRMTVYGISHGIGGAS
tara:strand:- start:949 stop:1839 length:891 start_codon:yes stop_codon:yes gene_type:complete